nr:CoA-binding protein [uncultured Romboutsia sp.]
MSLLKQKSWAVVIIDENEDSKEIKIMNLLKENNYNVVGINLNNYNSEKFSVYESLKDVPHNVDIVAIIEESIHNYYIIDEMELLDIKNIYFEKGSDTEHLLKKAKEARLNIVNFIDLYKELKLK